MTNRFSARVHIILAREARTAIVIRRGPSKSVCTLQWDRRKDTFQLGQWLRGRIYERRCDLSPDGRHFIYFAMNGKWESEAKGSWTGISKAPYLKAVGLWANGSCWNGGGLFMADRAYWLNVSICGHESQLEPAGLVLNGKYPFHEMYGGECPGVYYIRLQRDGWKLMEHRNEGGDAISIFEKPLMKGWILRKMAHATTFHPVGKGCYYDTHELVHPEQGLLKVCPDWEWADLDNDRIVWIANGILYGARMKSQGPGFVRALYDFNPLEFERRKAPY